MARSGLDRVIKLSLLRKGCRLLALQLAADLVLQLATGRVGFPQGLAEAIIIATTGLHISGNGAMLFRNLAKSHSLYLQQLCSPLQFQELTDNAPPTR